MKYNLIIAAYLLCLGLQFPNSTKPIKQALTYIEKDLEPTFNMVAIPAGTFTMGCTSEQQDCSNDEMPVHQVTLSSFYLSETEVTQAQWLAVMGTNPSRFKDCDDCPVERVSWNDIQVFLETLNEKSTRQYRLPTEAEWEYAAREGGKALIFGTGKNILDPAEANFDATATYKKPYSVGGAYSYKPTPVKTFKPNSLGLYDMAGNICEWCSDWYGNYSKANQTNPTGLSKGTTHVVRGGAWITLPQYCRATYRHAYPPEQQYNYLGFRLAASE